MGKTNVFYRVFCFYRDGFRSMTIGKTLWTIIFIKLFIMFGVLKVFFFPSHMREYNTQEEKGDYVIEQLTTRNPSEL